MGFTNNKRFCLPEHPPPSSPAGRVALFLSQMNQDELHEGGEPEGPWD